MPEHGLGNGMAISYFIFQFFQKHISSSLPAGVKHLLYCCGVIELLTVSGLATPVFLFVNRLPLTNEDPVDNPVVLDPPADPFPPFLPELPNRLFLEFVEPPDILDPPDAIPPFDLDPPNWLFLEFPVAPN